MGLTDFIRESGQKLFNRDEEAAARSNSLSNRGISGITGLGVKYSAELSICPDRHRAPKPWKRPCSWPETSRA